jgi:hypothetical protein
MINVNQSANKSDKMALKNQNKFKITNKLIDKAKNIGEMKRESSFINQFNQVSIP